MRASRRSLLPLALVLVVAGCADRAPAGSGRAEAEASTEITKERAVEIARQQVTFEPKTVEATRETEDGQPVWRVIFRGTPPQPGHSIGEYMEVSVDRKTGEIVTLSMS